MQLNRLSAILRSLQERGVEYILVGGLSAVLNGAPLSTFDVDIVHARSPENIAQLLAALESLDAVFRMQPERCLRPAASHLAGPGHFNLLTAFGTLNVLGEIGTNLSYGDLLGHSSDMQIGTGLKVRVLHLETLIALKEQLAGVKDVAVLGILRQTFQESRKRGNV